MDASLIPYPCTTELLVPEHQHFPRLVPQRLHHAHLFSQAHPMLSCVCTSDSRCMHVYVYLDPKVLVECAFNADEGQKIVYLCLYKWCCGLFY